VGMASGVWQEGFGLPLVIWADIVRAPSRASADPAAICSAVFAGLRTAPSKKSHGPALRGHLGGGAGRPGGEPPGHGRRSGIARNGLHSPGGIQAGRVEGGAATNGMARPGPSTQSARIVRACGPTLCGSQIASTACFLLRFSPALQALGSDGPTTKGRPSLPNRFGDRNCSAQSSTQGRHDGDSREPQLAPPGLVYHHPRHLAQGGGAPTRHLPL